MKPFEAFKPGTFTAADGKDWTFTAKDLDDIAASYDPAFSEAPLVVGHPTGDKPAYGWVKDVKVVDGVLMVEPHQVDPQFSDMVEANRFKKRSVRLWHPAAKGNPTPGKWQLRHVAFLGAVPPAVPGLKSVEFSAAEEGEIIVEFSAAERTIGWSLRSLAELARRFREYVLVKDGQEEADKLVPSYLVDNIAESAGRVIENAEPSFSSPNPELNVKTQAELDQAAANLVTREADIKKREDELAARDVAFSAAEVTRRRTDYEREFTELVKEGKLAPGYVPGLLDFMASVEAVETVEFSVGDQKVKQTPATFIMDFLKKSGTVVDFTERSTREPAATGDVAFAAPAGATVDPASLAIHNKAVAYRTANPTASYADALAATGAL